MILLCVHETLSSIVFVEVFLKHCVSDVVVNTTRVLKREEARSRRMGPAIREGGGQGGRSMRIIMREEGGQSCRCSKDCNSFLCAVARQHGRQL